PDDPPRIRWLYHCLYGASYPFSLVYDPQKCAAALADPGYLWLLARDGERAVGSLVFSVDREAKLGKVFGGVVHPGFQGHDLAERMMRLGLDALAKGGEARSVYATTRTVSLAPQRLAEKSGFKKLGIFPNVHKVQRSETHTLAVYYAPGALEKRRPPRLPAALKPFFQLVRREAGLPEAEYVELPAAPADDAPPTEFETVAAPAFVRRRFAEVKAAKALALDFFPFHEPDLLLVSPDGQSEVYLHRSSRDGHCVLNGARPGPLGLRALLDHAAAFLEGLGVRYFEVLVDAWDAQAVHDALSARFLPSAYYPAMRWDAAGARARDYVVLSRSLAVLDFSGIKLQPGYADYLKEYLRLWRELHLGQGLS
ncbi:MAG: GNAT family N-acetyltransferase, partial [Elusimicrobia bacterium]|nr:GNAT family N-acetyltransferase [Elusimicrobiota bacterium]